jgi:hypothetical protein
MRLLCCALAFVIAFSGKAQSWGYEGHRIIAEIAEQDLQPETAHHVRELLAIENATTLVEVSTWADEIRGQRRETARWHYVNIPIHPAAGMPARYDGERDCPSGDCVVAAVERFARVLSDTSAPPRERLEALKFVVHFVADLHQPLHASNNDDRGGNSVSVVFLGHPMSLHAMWDWGILEPAVRGDERGYAMRLYHRITGAAAADWQRGSPKDWANESYRVARFVIYPKIHRNVTMLEFTDGREFLPIVNEQLKKAGVRLANVLNQALP